MPVPHTLHIYQKPKLGSSFITRHLTYNYTHRISAIGWFDAASCNLRLSAREAEIAFEGWIGNRVALYVDNPVVPVWEGLISRVTPEFGNVVPTRSSDNMFNRALTTTADGTVRTQSTVGNTTASQAIYGIKQGSVEGYYDTAAATRRNALRDFLIAHQAWPQSSLSLNAGGRMVRVEMVGFYHTLEWESPVISTGGNSNPNVIITGVLSALGNGTTFFDNSVTSFVNTNTAFTINNNALRAETAWQFIVKATEPGDGADRWLAGILPTDPNTGKRYLYYREANSAIEYTAYARDGARIRNLYGGLVKPWDVRPDRSLRVNDILVGWSGQGDDPREIYIEAVDYDAETQRVALASADDITTDGIIQAKRFAKLHGTRFGPEPRQV